MDEGLLAGKGISPSRASPGYLDDYDLRIGKRATLVRHPGGRAYGVVMQISAAEATKLYAEDSVSDYVPESVIVQLEDGARVEAACYILPATKVTGTNRDYAELLLKLATRLGFPDSYLDRIRQELL